MPRPQLPASPTARLQSPSLGPGCGGLLLLVDSDGVGTPVSGQPSPCNAASRLICVPFFDWRQLTWPATLRLRSSQREAFPRTDPSLLCRARRPIRRCVFCVQWIQRLRPQPQRHDALCLKMARALPTKRTASSAWGDLRVRVRTNPDRNPYSVCKQYKSLCEWIPAVQRILCAIPSRSQQYAALSSIVSQQCCSPPRSCWNSSMYRAGTLIFRHITRPHCCRACHISNLLRSPNHCAADMIIPHLASG